MSCMCNMICISIVSFCDHLIVRNIVSPYVLTFGIYRICLFTHIYSARDLLFNDAATKVRWRIKKFHIQSVASEQIRRGLLTVDAIPVNTNNKFKLNIAQFSLMPGKSRQKSKILSPQGATASIINDLFLKFIYYRFKRVDLSKNRINKSAMQLHK